MSAGLTKVGAWERHHLRSLSVAASEHTERAADIESADCVQLQDSAVEDGRAPGNCGTCMDKRGNQDIHSRNHSHSCIHSNHSKCNPSEFQMYIRPADTAALPIEAAS